MPEKIWLGEPSRSADVARVSQPGADGAESIGRSPRANVAVTSAEQRWLRVRHDIPVQRGALQRTHRYASAATHLEHTQKVDGRGAHVPCLDFRQHRILRRNALDRRQLHTGCRSLAAACSALVGDAFGMKHARKVARRAMQRMMVRHSGVAPQPNPPTIHARTRRWEPQGHSRPRVLRSSQVPHIPLLSSVPVQILRR